jgi:DNA-binding Xre family transcriptional regulator
MNFSAALNATIDKFQLSGKDLALKSGLREATISDFRRGGAMRSDNLEKIFAVLPQQAKLYFFSHFVISQLDDQGISLLLYAMSEVMGKSQNQAELDIEMKLPSLV